MMKRAFVITLVIFLVINLGLSLIEIFKPDWITHSAGVPIEAPSESASVAADRLEQEHGQFITWVGRTDDKQVLMILINPRKGTWTVALLNPETSQWRNVLHGDWWGKYVEPSKGS